MRSQLEGPDAAVGGNFQLSLRPKTDLLKRSRRRGFSWVRLLAPFEDDCRQKKKKKNESECVQRPTQHINPTFVFQLCFCASPCAASGCSAGLARWIHPAVLSVQSPARVSRLGNGSNSLVMPFQPINTYDHQSSPDLMIRLEGQLCSIYCVGIWFQPRGRSHSLSAEKKKKSTGSNATDLFSALWLSWIIHLTYVHLNSDGHVVHTSVHTTLTVTPSTLQCMNIENPHQAVVPHCSRHLSAYIFLTLCHTRSWQCPVFSTSTCRGSTG